MNARIWNVIATTWLIWWRTISRLFYCECVRMLLLFAALCARAATALTHSVLEYGADPTGAAPSTRAVHAALADIAARGHGTLDLG